MSAPERARHVGCVPAIRLVVAMILAAIVGLSLGVLGGGGSILAVPIGVGIVSGTVGAGGGFLIVPALVLLGGLPMSAAVGTSLLVIAMNSVAGFAGYATSTPMNWAMLFPVTGIAILGSVVGSAIATRLDQATLRRGFG